MKKLTFLLTASLTFLSLSIGRYSLSTNECPPAAQLKDEESSVYCWLKAKQPESLDQLMKNFKDNNHRVWKKPNLLPSNIRLQSLEKVTSGELKARGLDENKSYYKGVTWMKKDFENKARQAIEKNQGILEYSNYIWLTPISQTQPFCQTCKGSLSNSQFSPLVITRLRLIQYLGLPLENPDRNHFVTIIAKDSDIIRPCLDQQIGDDRCNSPKSQQEKTNFIENNQGLIGKAYPWTALGYTYDWGNPANNVGASEYVIKSGATVFIESVEETKAFCQR